MDRISTTQGQLLPIKGSKGETASWLELMKLFHEAMSSGRWRKKYESPTDYLNAFAAASGNTPNTIRRYKAAYEFLQRQAEKKPKVWDPFAGGGGLAPAFTSVELIKRIHDVEPKAAERVFLRHRKGETTFRELKAEYDNLLGGRVDTIFANPPFADAIPLADAKKLGHRRNRRLSDDVRAMLEPHVSELSGPQARLYVGKYKFEFVDPSAVAVGVDGTSVSYVDGYEYVPSGPEMAPAQMRSLLADLTFQASFFRKFWVVFGEYCASANAIRSKLDRLHENSIGFAVENAQGQLRSLKKPADGHHADRQDLARAEVFSQGVSLS
ncbi:hypothetical protein [Ferrovibrio sp.]|uniref:hypothetical protein n=1 Tax=Ferrovibrio sp. TaxID=1917215 RepID=UPI003D113D75